MKIASSEHRVTTEMEHPKASIGSGGKEIGSETNAEEVCEGWLKVSLRLKPDHVRDHSRTLAEWLRRRPRTIRYMDGAELATLRAEIVDALLAQGSTLERANELTAGLPVVGDLLKSKGEGG